MKLETRESLGFEVQNLNLPVVALGERKDVDLAEFWKLGDTWSEVGDKGMCIWPYSILIADFTANHICCRLPANQGSHINGALLLYQPMQSNQLKRDRTKKFPQLNYIPWFGSLDRYLISSVESTVQMCQRKKRQNTRVVKVPSINHPSSIDHQHQWSGQGQATNGPNTTRAPKQHLCERNIRGHNTLTPRKGTIWFCGMQRHKTKFIWIWRSWVLRLQFQSQICPTSSPRWQGVHSKSWQCTHVSSWSAAQVINTHLERKCLHPHYFNTLDTFVCAD